MIKNKVLMKRKKMLSMSA